MYEPSLSPDGSEIAFVSGGQIWTVASSGGDAHLLVADSATKSRPIYSPDGNAIAFSSTRTGNGDIYIMDLGSGASRRLTWDDAPEYLSGWSRDGKWLYFYSSGCEISRSWNDEWRVAVAGGTPMQVVAERYVNEYHGAPSPDGKSLAFVARGYASIEWWRHGSSHIDQSQIWELNVKSGKYSPLTQDVAREVWPMWSPDSKSLYFVSDKDSGENIWRVERQKKPVRISNFKNERVLWPSISADGKTIVFERDLGIWKFDIAQKKASRVDIRLRGSSSTEAPDHQKVKEFAEIALAPDGKKVALIARGDVFITSAKDGGDGLRVTSTQEESQLAWSPDSKAIAYVSRRGDTPHLYEWDSSTLTEQQLTFERAVDYSPLYSPDGKSIAFIRNGKQIMRFDRKAKRTALVATRHFDGQLITPGQPFAWSPDSRWIAFIGLGDDFIHNAYVVDASGGNPVQVSFLPDAQQDVNSIHWAAGGHQLLYVTKQRTELGHIARVTLVQDQPKFADDKLRGLFHDEQPKAAANNKPSAITLDFKGIRDRTRLCPVGLDIRELVNSPDGKWIAFSANVPADNDDGNQRVYAIPADAAFSDSGAAPILLASTSRGKQFLGFSPDSKEVFFLDGKHIAAATPEPPTLRTIAATCELDVDVAKESKMLLNDTWSILGESYYDPKMHGADWDRLLKHYRGFVQSARSRDETRRILNLMIGELNSSHSGVYVTPDQTTTGRVGVRFDRGAYEDHAQLKVSEVLDSSPAEIAGIRVGDVIVAVNGRPIVNFEQSFEHMIGKRVTVTIKGPPEHDVVVKPINTGAEQRLLYRAWRIHNRELVDKLSKGQLGYVHMYDMTAASLTKFVLELDTEVRKKKGVIVDVRNNNGGFVDPYAIDVLARKPYLYMTPRGLPKGSERTILGQRALERPTILVVNRHSLSDSEDFAEGYRALGLGKIVGEPTAGWIIFTDDVTLVDGTHLRLPDTKVSDLKGNNLELHPRPVDFPVQRSIGETGDSQLKAAVTELLHEVK